MPSSGKQPTLDQPSTVANRRLNSLVEETKSAFNTPGNPARKIPSFFSQAASQSERISSLKENLPNMEIVEILDDTEDGNKRAEMSESHKEMQRQRPTETRTIENESKSEIKCSKSTIILFDDVDVIFEDGGDRGFWAALETVLKNSRKPCIVTATRGYHSIIQKCRALRKKPVMNLHRPSPTQVGQLIIIVLHYVISRLISAL